jgi:ribonuclease VapC
MFLDSSAMLAILMGESPALSDARETADRRLTSSAVRLETCMVLASRRDWAPARVRDFFDDFAFQAGISEISIDERIGQLAVACFERFGKGRRPAQTQFRRLLVLRLRQSAWRAASFYRQSVRQD